MSKTLTDIAVGVIIGSFKGLFSFFKPKAEEGKITKKEKNLRKKIKKDGWR